MDKTKMIIINKKLKARQFINYIENLKVRRKIDKIVFHHTSSPISSWQNSGSMLHYWNLYRSRGWRHGPNIFIAPSGIWLFSPITKQGRGAPGDGNKRSIHIEIVGRYFTKSPENPTICLYTAIVASMLMSKFNLKKTSLHNHFEYEPYANETKYITGEWVMEMIAKYQKHIDKLAEFNHDFDQCWKLATIKK